MYTIGPINYMVPRNSSKQHTHTIEKVVGTSYYYYGGP